MSILEQKCTVIKRTINEDAAQLSHIRYIRHHHFSMLFGILIATADI